MIVVLLKGSHIVGVDPSQFEGQPVMSEPGSTRVVGTVKSAWIAGDELRAEIEMTDPVFHSLLSLPEGKLPPRV